MATLRAKSSADVMSDPIVLHSHAASRFEATVDGHLCVAEYRTQDGVMSINHTYVPPPLEGRGVAAHLVAAALVHAREQGLRVRPVCSYVAAYMRRRPESHDLLEASHG